MTEQQKRAQRAVAAIAAILAEDEANLWPDDIRWLQAAQGVAGKLARRGQ